jgi:hypothetical protein
MLSITIIVTVIATIATPINIMPHFIITDTSHIIMKDIQTEEVPSKPI